MNRLVIIVISVVLIITAAVFTWHDRHKGHIKEKPGDVDIVFKYFFDKRGLEVLKTELGLSDSQYKAISDLNNNRYSEAKEHKAILAKKLEELNSNLIQNAEFNEKETRRVLSEIASERVELGIIRFKQKYEIDQLLTSEQKVKFNTMLKEKLAKFRGKRSGDISAGDNR